MWMQLNIPSPVDKRIKALAEHMKMDEHEVVVDLLIKSTDKIWLNKTW